MAAVLDVTDQTFETEVLKSSKPAIIDFWAEWCAPLPRRSRRSSRSWRRPGASRSRS